jgi:FkbM family methyltransferase
MTGHAIAQIWKALRHPDRALEILRCAAETPQWAGVSAAYLGFSRPRYPFLLQLHHEKPIPIEELTDLKAFWQIYLRRVYRVDAKDRNIVDLGANVGIFSLYAARCAPQAQILAVEPFPSTFGRLVATVRDHDLEHRVTCLNAAATGANGVRVMPDAPLPTQRHALASPSFSASVGSGTHVAGKTLEAILDESQIQQADLLKVDIEGSEYEVFLPTSQNVLARIHRIAMEYHGDCAPYSKQQLFDHLRKAGFTVAWDICDAQGYGVTEMIRRN